MATYNNIKKIKIGDNIFNLYDSGNSGGTITSVKTTAGTHTTINVTSGAANFNVPTKTSHLTNDSGYITASHTSTYSLPLAASGTRGGIQVGYSTSGKNYAVQLSSEKAYVNVPWTDTTVSMTETNPSNSTNYYPIWYTATTGTVTQLHVNNGFIYNTKQGTASAEGNGDLILGNNIATGTAGNKSGAIWLYSSSSGFGILTQASTTTTGLSHVLPATGGTILNTGTTSFTQSLTSGTQVGTIKINGTETKLYAPTNTNTTNTAGSNNTSSKIFLVGTTSQTTGSSGLQSYSHDTAYVGTNGSIYSEDMTTSNISSFVSGLEIGGGGTAVDLIVEQGTSGIWTYRKWSSGISECWGSVTTTTALTTWVSPISYGSTYSARQTFPTGLFTAVPKEFVSLSSGTDSWLCSDSTNKVTATQTGRYYIVRPSSPSGNFTFTVYFHDIGTWK